MMESPPLFNSVEDECRYWKERAKLYHKEWTDVKQEYDEYVEQSREMEAEMDATLDQKTATIKDLRFKITSLEKENESLKLKLESHNVDFTSVEKQLENVKLERDSMKEYLRQLEQKNDDLERAHRILNESIVDFERMLDKAYEKNALLEMEVDEKEVLQEKLQRLMDETRDLKQELNVKTRYTSPNGTQQNGLSPGSEVTTPNGINGDIMSHAETATATTNILNNTNTTNSTTNINDYQLQQRSLKRKPFGDPDNLLNGNAAMTASSRTTALNIVADMLRKINLDKALLCHQCERFRCVCERTPAAEKTLGVSTATTASNDSNAPRSSTDQLNCNRTPAAEESPDNNNVLLRRSTSQSNTSLNFGTNIFKRFAERMSANNNFLATTLRSATSSNDILKDP
ncbi:nuclear distribution protein nudE homolog [Stomoxys calcitrans]|uniref:NUDE domain-containing protein n=1 Tax=Stomoxys calcitrans TaxID=35570 RepID=A0A1I8Q3H8_STOCA|nr:nuclear distribution protein nudE homolog [Stomoxys calcitrans]XP_059219613.1 nuclear distribution protein nudE homolog [Stomoxys calcitrans]